MEIDLGVSRTLPEHGTKLSDVILAKSDDVVAEGTVGLRGCKFRGMKINDARSGKISPKRTA